LLRSSHSTFVRRSMGRSGTLHIRGARLDRAGSADRIKIALKATHAT
jgi:hypothetical protein